jgi:hypothetical protein
MGRLRFHSNEFVRKFRFTIKSTGNVQWRSVFHKCRHLYKKSDLAKQAILALYTSDLSVKIIKCVTAAAYFIYIYIFVY